MITQRDGLYLEEDGTPAGGGGGETPEDTQPQTWEAWLESQDEGVQTLYQQHTRGLKSALESERDARKTIESQLRDLSQELEQGSAAREKLDALSADFDQAQRRVEFYESAPADLSNARLAWLAAQESEAFDRRGNVQWDTLRERYPELFNKQPTSVRTANAGTSAKSAGNAGFDMNAVLREAAGRNRL